MTATSRPAIAFEEVAFWYDPANRLLERFSWTVVQGESWAIVGPSGCGKSTLLYLIAGLRQPCAGRILLNGEEVIAPRRTVGLMLQDYGLLDWYTAARNIELGLQIRKIPARERAQRLNYWLHELSIDHVRDRFPLHLSGGQRQRVALARLLALETPLQLLDEPLSAVDELTRERLQQRLVQINRSLGASTITVTHNIEEAVLLGDKVLVITEYAPIVHFHVIDTLFDHIPKRDDPDFVASCREIRQLIGL